MMEVHYREVLIADSDEAVNEASLNRVYQHFLNRNEQSFIVMSAYTHDDDGEALPGSQRAFKNLKNYVKGRGWSFINLRGYWKQTNSRGEEIVVSEPSLFIMGPSLEDAKDLRKKFDQEAVVFAGPESDGNVLLIDGSGDPMDLGRFTPKKVGDIFSKVKGRPFTFVESVNSQAKALLKSNILPQNPNAAVREVLEKVL